MLSAAIALVLILSAVLAPWIAPHDPMDLASLSLLDSFKPPVPMSGSDWSNLLGTDNQGRDVLSAIMYGMRISLVVGFCLDHLRGRARHRHRPAGGLRGRRRWTRC